MPEMFLTMSDVVLISWHLREIKKRPNGIAPGLWKRLRSDSRWVLDRLSMQDLRSLAIVAPSLMPELGLWEPSWAVNDEKETDA